MKSNTLIPMTPDQVSGMGNKELKNFCFVNVSVLRKADWNYKEDDAAKLQKLVNNIRSQGFTENIHIRLLKREKKGDIYEVINGNHRYDAAVEIGLEWLPAYNHGEIPIEEAQLRAIEQNETRFPTNHFKLSQLLKGIQSNFNSKDFLDALPFDQTQIANLIGNDLAEVKKYMNNVEIHNNQVVTHTDKDREGSDDEKKKRYTFVLSEEALEKVKKIAEADSKKATDKVHEVALKQKLVIELSGAMFNTFMEIFGISPDNDYSTLKLVEFLKEPKKF